MRERGREQQSIETEMAVCKIRSHPPPRDCLIRCCCHISGRQGLDGAGTVMAMATTTAARTSSVAGAGGA
jgi:hypothetical protein